LTLTLDSMSPAAQAEAAKLGLRNPFKELPSEIGFAAWFAVIEENFRALQVAECRAVFDRYQGEDAGDLDRFRECYLAYCHDEMVERHCRANLDDLTGLLHRRVELFLEQVLQFRIAGDPAVAEQQTPLEERFVKFRGEVGDKQLSFGQLNQVIKRSADRLERQQAWESFLPLGRESREALLDLVEQRNRLARNLGYRDFVDLRWKHSNIDEAWLMGVLDTIERETAAPYAAMCEDLAQMLGVPKLAPWDVAYAVDIVSPLPPETFDQHSALTRVEKLLRGWGFPASATQIPAMRCDSFSMGGLCFGIEPGKEVAILFAPADGPRFYRTFFHEFGHAMHFRNAGMNSILLNVEDMAFNEGMAVFYESFVSDPLWVRANFEDMSEADAEAYCKHARYAALAWMRTLLVNVRFEHALYAHPERDPDAYFLELQRTCGGFDLPSAASVRWAADQMTLSLPINWHNYVIAELIARQTREFLLARDGALLDNPRVGEFLMNQFYLPGAVKSWPEKVAEATGKPLDADAFFRYLRAV
jgi:peptidyl-dipeptidase A